MVNFPFFIARRYLFSKKKHHTINIISFISMAGIAIATMAMVCILSGFNGFRDLIGQLFTNFDPQIEIVPAEGKTALQNDATLQKIQQYPGIASYAYSLEDNALILFKGHPKVIVLKGVDDNYIHTVDFGNILYGTGSFQLHSLGEEYGIPGIGLSNDIGSLNFGKIQICAPKKGEQINLTNPIENINVGEISSTGICFQVNQSKYDNNYLVTSLAFAQNLFERPNQISELEIKLKNGVSVSNAKEAIQKIAGKKYLVKDRYEQQEGTFNVMKIEKLFAFFFLTFILILACFNIIGSISMLMIDKREDVNTLRNLGATNRQIAQIFTYEGRMICFIGDMTGIAFGLLLCFLQQQYGWLKLGNASGSFIIDAYPVSVHFTDIALIFITVLIVGFLSAAYPVRYFSKRFLS